MSPKVFDTFGRIVAEQFQERTCRAALEVGAVGVAVQGKEVVPGEEHVGADLLGLRAGTADRGVVRVLRLELHPDADGPVTGQGVTSWPLATTVRPDSVTWNPRARSCSRSTPMVVSSGT